MRSSRPEPIATDAWAAGALVGSVADLHGMLSALFGGLVISTELLGAMTPNDRYGFGIEPFSELGELYGHGGGIPGYGTLVMHAPETGKTAVWAMTNDTRSFDVSIESVAESVAQP